MLFGYKSKNCSVVSLYDFMCEISEISTVRLWYVQLVGEEVCVTSLLGDQRSVPFLWHSVGLQDHKKSSEGGFIVPQSRPFGAIQSMECELQNLWSVESMRINPMRD